VVLIVKYENTTIPTKKTIAAYAWVQILTIGILDIYWEHTSRHTETSQQGN
jgi:hypothetical protein